ncbi:putative bifunctional diguanylate cyclase/phosphodiesterase [Duganella fentianensis]|nr:EAL domain-containing protein [Duganella fentianensis]
MSTDLGSYAHLSAIAAAFAADAILSTLLIFLWLMQRKEKHALYWGLGQLSVMSGIVLWFIGGRYLAEVWRIPLCAALLAAGMVGYWSGTKFFLGELHRAQQRWILPVALAITLACYVVWDAMPSLLAPGSAAILGVVMVWCGQRLIRNKNRYRFLGVTLLLRGVFNVLSSVTLGPELYLFWFIGTTVLKTLSMLGLIYAVQDEIQQRYARTIDSLSNGFLIRDRRGYVQVANERCARLLGFAGPADLVGKHVSDLLPGLTPQMADEYFQRFMAPGAVYPLVETAMFQLHDGSRLPVELLASPYEERGRLYCLVQLLDISERTRKDDLLRKAANIDPVTGYFNRHAITNRLREEVTLACSGGCECAVLFIDLDKFKRVNDSFGHAVGDELLRQFARRLHSVLGTKDVLARFGGDEFIVVLPELAAGSAEQQARACAEQIVAAMDNSFTVTHHVIGVSASVGVACYPQHGMDGATLIRHADIAMYVAKKSGRGEVRFFNDAMNAAAKDALVIDGALRSAIAGQEFRLVYQAITSAASGALTKVEALLRWQSATLGNVAPDRFIPVAEDSGMIVEIGTWVLNEACRQLGVWKAGALGELTVSINVSAWQLADPAFVGLVQQALAHNDLSPRQLELELTERVLIDNGGEVQSVLAQLRGMGVGISLDDFGTGYSSLSYLTQFHLNTLKIDRAFVMDIEHSERSNNLVHAIIAMGQSLGLQLVAEGVETAGQASILRQLGCHHLQGYHISLPIPADELPAFACRLKSAGAVAEVAENA